MINVMLGTLGSMLCVLLWPITLPMILLGKIAEKLAWFPFYWDRLINNGIAEMEAQIKEMDRKREIEKNVSGCKCK